MINLVESVFHYGKVGSSNSGSGILFPRSVMYHLPGWLAAALRFAINSSNCCIYPPEITVGTE